MIEESNVHASLSIGICLLLHMMRFTRYRIGINGSYIKDDHDRGSMVSRLKRNASQYVLMGPSTIRGGKAKPDTLLSLRKFPWLNRGKG